MCQSNHIWSILFNNGCLIVRCWETGMHWEEGERLRWFENWAIGGSVKELGEELSGEERQRQLFKYLKKKKTTWAGPRKRAIALQGSRRGNSPLSEGWTTSPPVMKWAALWEQEPLNSSANAEGPHPHGELGWGFQECRGTWLRWTLGIPPMLRCYDSWNLMGIV